MLLVDTSVWIEVFRRDTKFRLDSVVEIEEVATCLPVIQEVLQGFRDERAFQLARNAMYAFPIVETPLTTEVFDQAVDLYRRMRRVGLTIRSSIDCLIAACAERSNLTVLHTDRDFESIAQVSQLRVQRIQTR